MKITLSGTGFQTVICVQVSKEYRVQVPRTKTPQWMRQVLRKSALGKCGRDTKAV